MFLLVTTSTLIALNDVSHKIARPHTYTGCSVIRKQLAVNAAPRWPPFSSLPKLLPKRRMSSDAEEIDLRQFDNQSESPSSRSSDYLDDDKPSKRSSRKRKYAETALGPLNIYSSLSESELYVL